MRSILTISIILTFLLNIKGQSVDTIKFWHDLKLITDIKLLDKNRCTSVDTSISWHACNNYNGEDIELTFYDFDTKFCDSLELNCNADEKKLLKFKRKRKIEDKNKRVIRLIPDSYYLNKLYYSPEILFQIQIGKNNYNFNSIDQKYNLESDVFNQALFIKERIPNAFIHFSKEMIEVKVITDKDSIIINSNKENIYYLKGQLNEEHKPKYIIVTIANECRDKLIMKFKIN